MIQLHIYYRTTAVLACTLLWVKLCNACYYVVSQYGWLSDCIYYKCLKKGEMIICVVGFVAVSVTCMHGGCHRVRGVLCCCIRVGRTNERTNVFYDPAAVQLPNRLYEHSVAVLVRACSGSLPSRSAFLAFSICEPQAIQQYYYCVNR